MFGDQKFVGDIINWGSNKCGGQKMFGFKKELGVKKMLESKICEGNIFWEVKYFGGQILLGVKHFGGQQLVVVQKKLGSTHYGNTQFLEVNNFGG